MSVRARPLPAKPSALCLLFPERRAACVRYMCTVVNREWQVPQCELWIMLTTEGESEERRVWISERRVRRSSPLHVLVMR